jgi:hypothetical protein
MLALFIFISMVFTPTFSTPSNVKVIIEYPLRIFLISTDHQLIWHLRIVDQQETRPVPVMSCAKFLSGKKNRIKKIFTPGDL